ncbi:TPA: hypothetical protein QDA98_004603 [Burkholderia vietnamiensis]|nr:hypothetical protein [Burkholderia vietnamiensis]
MSSRLRIPQQRKDGLIAVSKLSDDEVRRLFAELVELPVRPHGPDFAEETAQKFGYEDKQGIALIIETLVSLYAPLVASNSSIDDFVNDVVLAFDEVLQEANADEQMESLRQNLRKLLRVPSFALSSKATALLYENERSFLNARILTEVRPVFSLEEDEIGAAIITQTLKLEYFAGNEQQELFVALDADDIQGLIDKLQRAQSKQKKLAELLDKASIPLFSDAEEA